MMPELPEEIARFALRPMRDGFFLFPGKVVAKPFICRRCGRIHVAYGTSKRHVRKNIKAIEERCRCSCREKKMVVKA